MKRNSVGRKSLEAYMYEDERKRENLSQCVTLNHDIRCNQAHNQLETPGVTKSFRRGAQIS